MTDQVPAQGSDQDPQPPQTTAPPDGGSSPPQKSGTSPVLIIGLVALIVLLVAAIAFVMIGNSGTPSTPAPPEVIVPTPLPGSPSATALEPVNVRSGPGTNYPSYGVAAPGTQAEVIGVSPDGGWWVVSISIEYAPDGRGWVSADWVSVENAEGVPVIEPPPMP